MYKKESLCMSVSGNNYEVHAIPAGKRMEDIHRNYGLWIIRYHSGGGKINSFFSCRKRYFQYYALTHMYDGSGCFWLEKDDSRQDIQPGDALMVTPGTVHRYGGVNDAKFIEDSVNFCGPVADMLFNSGIISNGVYSLGRVRKLKLIIDFFSDPSVDSQICANIELQKLLVELYLNKKNKAASGHPLLEDLLLEIRNYPRKWWSVEEMAEICNLSVDQMRRIFFQRTGVTPKLYVDRIKLNSAAELLLAGETGISEIASLYGYKDQYHFSRRFKEIMGMAPRDYRSFFNGVKSSGETLLQEK